MNVSAATDYGMQALLYLARAYRHDPADLCTAQEIATAHKLPVKYLEALLRTLRLANIIESHRGASGGYCLSRPPKEISVAQVIRALDGPLAAVRGERPESIKYSTNNKNLQDVWIATRVALRNVLEDVNLDHVLSGKFPNKIENMLEQPGAWERRE